MIFPENRYPLFGIMLEMEKPTRRELVSSRIGSLDVEGRTVVLSARSEFQTRQKVAPTSHMPAPAVGAAPLLRTWQQEALK